MTFRLENKATFTHLELQIDRLLDLECQSGAIVTPIEATWRLDCLGPKAVFLKLASQPASQSDENNLNGLVITFTIEMA